MKYLIFAIFLICAGCSSGGGFEVQMFNRTLTTLQPMYSCVKLTGAFQSNQTLAFCEDRMECIRICDEARGGK